jgi:hypothetical protein
MIRTMSAVEVGRTVNLKNYISRFFLVILFSLSIYALCVADNSYNGMVTGQSVRLRAGPSRIAEVLAVLNQGVLVEVVEKNNSWYRVIVGNSRIGWIYQDYITTETTAIQNRVAFINRAKELAEFAKKYLGYRYSYGGIGPSGFDCSGYTMFVYGNFGYKLPHSASSQTNLGEGIKRSDLTMGDLLFFKTMRSPSINHVGIYLGDGSFIHAASGAGRIKIDSVYSHYYSSRYWGARRILVYGAERKGNSN